MLDIFPKLNQQEKVNQKQQKMVHFLVNKSKKLSQNNKKINENVAAGGFATLTE